jgi:hypothetical protein
MKSLQYIRLHEYARYAGMNDLEYRNILRSSSGCVTSTDPSFDEHAFERTMASLETVLWDRVARSIVPDPRYCTVCGRPLRRAKLASCPEGCEQRRLSAWSESYWRDRLPREGWINSRQLWKLRQLWGLLTDYLPPEDRTEEYLAGLIARASGRSLSLCVSGRLQWERIPHASATRATDALRDRLRYAVRTPKTETSDVPF